MAVNTTAELIGRIKAKRNAIALSLAAGIAQSFEAYQRLVGEYTGLGETLDILDTLLQEED